MQKKKIMLVGAKARQEIRAGVDLLADAVKLTLGPKGKNFASGIKGGSVAISNDGVSLAKEIQGRNEFEDIGVRAAREAATKTDDIAGDGTTTSVVLEQAILEVLGFNADAMGPVNPTTIAQVAKETDEVVGMLEDMQHDVETEAQLIAVAKVSVEDDALAELIGGAQWKVGKAGTVLAEEHNDPKDTVEYVYGVRIDNGFGTSRMANDAALGALVLENMPIIVTNKIFNTADTIRALNPLFEKMITGGATGVVLIGKAFDDTAIALCMSNITKYFEGKGGFPMYPINAPYIDQDEVLEDLAAATGGKFIQANERNVESLQMSDVGMATKVFVKRYEGVITGPKQGEDERIDAKIAARVEKITEKLTGQVSAFEKRQLEARLAQLTAGTAVIKVGAETEQERKYKKDKVDDAVKTVKAAIQEGVVPGAGQSLKRAGELLLEANPRAILPAALRAPYDQIMSNAGGEFEVPVWVEDPLKVVKTAFLKASSIARSLATTEVVVTYEDEKPMWVKQAGANMADNDED